MSENTPRTEPPVPFSAGGRRYHDLTDMRKAGILYGEDGHEFREARVKRWFEEANAYGKQDNPDYQDKALARLQRRYRTADLIVGALVALVLVLFAAAIYRWFVLP